MDATSRSPLVLHGRHGTTARLEEDALVIRTRREARRIPVEAIERAEARGRGGRTFAVVLTGADTVAEGGTVRCTSAPAVAAFVARVREEIPVRDAAEAHRDGAALVSVEPVGKRRPRPRATGRQLAWTATVIVYLLVLAWLIAAVRGGEAGQNVLRPISALIYWAVWPLLTWIGWLVAKGLLVETVGPTWGLRTHGITVTGRLVQDAQSLGWFYEFTDQTGKRRTCPAPEQKPSEVEIVYDARNPSRAMTRPAMKEDRVFGLVLGLILLPPSLGAGVVLLVLGVIEIVELYGWVGLIP
ncbi:hypothetical protein ABT354_09305 [Streptomyces sp. NPDC000594]|uniref:hypothetical protein n=1 Tax=Streptomyces sp. NPDC000594 TaxID=3154261 RepID=UPI0033204533